MLIPKYKLEYDQKNITKDVSDYVVSIDYTDYEHGSSDEISIVFEDCPLYKWIVYSKPENMDKWKIVDGIFTDITDTPEYIKNQKQKETERIGNLKMTCGDFFEAMILAQGIGKSEIRTIIETSSLVPENQRKLFLNRFDEALDFYRKYPIFDLLSGELGVTSKQLDMFFETKNYEFLISTNSNLTIETNNETRAMLASALSTREELKALLILIYMFWLFSIVLEF